MTTIIAISLRVSWSLTGCMTTMAMRASSPKVPTDFTFTRISLSLYLQAISRPLAKTLFAISLPHTLGRSILLREFRLQFHALPHARDPFADCAHAQQRYLIGLGSCYI